MFFASRDSYLGCVGLISDPLIPFCFGHVQLREQCNLGIFCQSQVCLVGHRCVKSVLRKSDCHC